MQHPDLLQPATPHISASGKSRTCHPRPTIPDNVPPAALLSSHPPPPLLPPLHPPLPLPQPLVDGKIIKILTSRQPYKKSKKVTIYLIKKCKKKNVKRSSICCPGYNRISVIQSENAKCAGTSCEHTLY